MATTWTDKSTANPVAPILGDLSVLYTTLTTVSTVADTNETTGGTYNLAAGHLDFVGKGYRIRAWGSTVLSGGTKVIKVKFGSTTLKTLSLGAGEDWEITCDIYRDGTASQKGYAKSRWTTAGTAFELITATEDETAAITIATTIQNGTAFAGGVTFEGMTITAIQGP